MEKKRGHLNSRLRTDGARLPDLPPDDLEGEEEREAYRYLLDKVKRTAYAELVDLPALVLASQRLAHVRFCRKLANEAKRSGNWFIENNRKIQAHPILTELRAAESSLNTSLGSLYLNPRSRANARGRGEVDQALELSGDEREAHDDLLK